MAIYKEHDCLQGKYLPLRFDKQILFETFEHNLWHVQVVLNENQRETR